LKDYALAGAAGREGRPYGNTRIEAPSIHNFPARGAKTVGHRQSTVFRQAHNGGHEKQVQHLVTDSFTIVPELGYIWI